MLIRIIWCKEREENINKIIDEIWCKVEVIWDKEKNVIETLCRALDTDKDVIILEDDVELCNNFLEKAKAEIKKHKGCFIMFYNANAAEIIEYDDENYIWSRVWTQAYYIPKWVAKGMAEYVKNDTEYSPLGRYSNPMYQYLEKCWIKMHLVKPSLVQHLWFWSLIPWHEHCNHYSRKFKK